MAVSVPTLDDRDFLYGELPEHHLRIGDSQFLIPPTSIQVNQTMKTEKITMLRSRGSLPVQSGYSEQFITISLFFPNEDAINYEMRPLLAQMKKCPFLPIENTYLNNVYKINAIVINDVTAQTNPGFPGTMTLLVQMFAFDPATYIYGSSDKDFNDMFNWPLFRWYYEQNLIPQTDQRHATYYEPLTEPLNDSFFFKIASEDDLIAMRQWRLKKTKLIQDWAQQNKSWSFSDFFGFLKGKVGQIFGHSYKSEEEQFDDDLDNLYHNAMFDYDISYEPWPTGDLILTDLAVSFENHLSTMQLEMDENPTYQYLGSGDVTIIASFEASDEESLASLQNLIDRGNYYLRTYREEMLTGAIEFDCQLARLFGIKNVVISNMVVDTVENQPGVYSVKLTMYGYNRIAKKMNEVRAMTLGLEWSNGGTNALKYIIPFVGPVLFGADRPFFKVFTNYMKDVGDDIKVTKDGVQLAIYQSAVLETFKMAEVYPDLELPTYDEVEAAGFSIKNLNDGIFVDPDFFLVYDDIEDYARQVDTVFKTGGDKFGLRLEDMTGNNASVDGTKIKPAKDDKKKKSTGLKSSPPKETKLDTKNNSTDQNEKLLRQAAKKYGISDKFIVGFATSFDPKLRQYYDKGANPDFNYLYSSQETSTITQKQDLKYTIGQEGADYYYGVMRVRPTLGYSVLLEKRTDYNIDQGTRAMAVSIAHLRAGYDDKNDYHYEHLANAFDLDLSSKEDASLCEFMGGVMIYLGYERELAELLKNNRQLSSQLSGMLKDMVSTIKKTDGGTSKTDLIKLPVKDYKNISDYKAPSTLVAGTQINEDDFGDLESSTIKASMCHDTILYDHRGRLVRAFPSFFIAFIDEGRYVGTSRMSDQFFQYRGVTSIEYDYTRKSAANTLFLTMSNVYGSLSDSEKAQDLTYSSTWDVFQSLINPASAADQLERSRHRDPNYYKTIMLTTGTRVHFRMGYGSNIQMMPTIINGTITSIENKMETLHVAVQGDGIELTNKLNAVYGPDDSTETFLHSKKEPTEILDELLTDSQGFWHDLIAGLSNSEFNNHSLGIMHFGAPGPPEGWNDVGFQPFLESINPKNWFGASRKIGEVNMNVYNTNGLTHKEEDTWWNNIRNTLGFGDSDEDNININLFDKTFWDIVNICAAIGDDFIAAVHPFDFRSTIFMGKPYFPLHYGYQVALGQVVGTKVKVFRQLHSYDSYTNIINNAVLASEENMYNVAVGTYMDEGKTRTTQPVYVDTNIWPEKQRTVNIDTTLNAKGMKFVDKIPLIGGLLNKPAKWYFDEGVALKITAAGLRDYVKDMYQGYLTVMGDPSVKPYDQCFMQDEFNLMSGTFDVKEIIHYFDKENGFISMIKPDIIAFNNDRRIYSLGTEAMHVLCAASTTWVLRKILRSKGYNTTLPVMNAIWSSTRKSLVYAKQKFDTKKLKSKIQEFYGNHIKGATEQAVTDDMEKAAAAENVSRSKQQISASTIKKWVKNGSLKSAAKNLKDVSAEELQAILKGGKSALSNLKFTKNLGIERSKLLQLSKRSASGLLKGAKFAAGGAARGGKYLVGASSLLAGPPGWVGFALESALTFVGTATIGEFLHRFLANRHSVVVVPLMKDGVAFCAGLNGHKGAILGDSPDMISWLSNTFIGDLFLGFTGVDTSDLNASSQSVSIQMQVPASTYNDKTAKKKSQPTQQEDAETWLNQIYRRPIMYDPEIQKLYDADYAAKEKEWKDHLDELGKGLESALYADYSKLFNQGQEFINELQKMFSNFLNSVFGDNDDSGGGSVDGKAVHISAQVKKYQSKIEKYAKKYKVDGYVQLLMAIMMQESGGRGNDPMQSGQSSPDASIKRGCAVFKESLDHGHKYGMKTVIQGYNMGPGFCDYVGKHGKKFKSSLAYSFSAYMKSKHGYRVFGDPDYVAHVLRYYEGSLEPSSGGSGDAPSTVGSAGKKKYHLSQSKAKKTLINLHSQKGKHFGLTLVDSGSGLIRKGSYEVLNNIAEKYKKETGQTLNVTSAYRPGDSNWHGTGYAVDVDTPNTMVRQRNGKLGFKMNSKDRKNAEKLVNIAAQCGMDGFVFGDYSLLQEVKSKHKGLVTQYRPQDHYNHFHMSYPKKKK
jgi:hypothetical protein